MSARLRKRRVVLAALAYDDVFLNLVQQVEEHADAGLG